jgi:spermidine dehydrogenase
LANKSNINRRDFINGTALSLALGTTLSPLEILAQTAARQHAAVYPPALTGMRGSHDGSFEVAHAVARLGKTYPAPRQQTDQTYDLIVVGGGISGLSAAKFYRDRATSAGNILILDNHDDFGGHARRNEFNVDGKVLLGYGGSQSIDSPAKYSDVAQQLLRDLSIDVQRFYEYFDQDYFGSRGMRGGIFFDRATFGTDKLVANPIAHLLGGALEGEDLVAAVAAMPIGDEDQSLFLRLLEEGVDYLDGMSVEQKIELLDRISYLDYLKKYTGMSDTVCAIMQDTFLQMISMGWESESAYLAAIYGYPGTRELGVQANGGSSEPYIFHFPDGNAGIARALVRDLNPAAVPGKTMEDLVAARADYALLDNPDASARIRLNSTAVEVRNSPDDKFVDVTYVQNGNIYRSRARHVVMACYNGILPHICPEMPVKQAEAIGYSTKIPFVLGSIALRNWRAFAEAGVSRTYSPGDVYFKHQALDFPVSMGGYHFAKAPDDPVVLTAWYSPTTRGLPARDQFRAGRARLMQMSFADFEDNLHAHLDAMLGPHGFNSQRDIAAITLNRWPHGYAYEYEGLRIPREYDREHGPHIAGRQQLGRISIANSDSEAYAYANGAIDAADRAVNEQLHV